ncbi:MAG: carboxypeptidase-like regulatory domain-containing protein [Bacteroidetes bacterium]|nr:carboxypeptidase-like regulatory domain-containing protein [Bacteroidota bacterium]MCY4234329.1 carboxypeptidase-like regulatory domain-containing protein [Bacteroidota bacterium]
MGQVSDASSDLPLQGAHIFIASSLIGAASGVDGSFQLNDIPPGAHRIVISMLGYETASIDTLLRENQSYDLDLRLHSIVVELEEVVINARLARRWQRRLKKFTRLFIGETINSQYTTIINPEVLSFKSRLGKLSATASAPLIIENRALGYQLHYYLKEFFYFGTTIKYDGEPSFTELTPSDSLEWDRWQSNREIAFFGSDRHFLLSLITQRTQDEGFQVHHRNSMEPSSTRFQIDPARLIEQGPTPLEKLLSFSRILEVTYDNELEDESFKKWQRQPNWQRPGPQRSFMELNSGPTLIDESGEVIDPYGVVMYGYFAFERIADKVPKEYRPPNWMP